MEENRKIVDDMLELISSLSNTQLDESITTELKKLIGKPIPEIKTGVMKAIDYCVYGGLASRFALLTLRSFHEYYLDGKDEDFTIENCPWRTKLI